MAIALNNPTNSATATPNLPSVVSLNLEQINKNDLNNTSPVQEKKLANFAILFMMAILAMTESQQSSANQNSNLASSIANIQSNNIKSWNGDLSKIIQAMQQVNDYGNTGDLDTAAVGSLGTINIFGQTYNLSEIVSNLKTKDSSATPSSVSGGISDLQSIYSQMQYNMNTAQNNAQTGSSSASTGAQNAMKNQQNFSEAASSEIQMMRYIIQEAQQISP